MARRKCQTFDGESWHCLRGLFPLLAGFRNSQGVLGKLVFYDMAIWYIFGAAGEGSSSELHQKYSDWVRPNFSPTSMILPTGTENVREKKMTLRGTLRCGPVGHGRSPLFANFYPYKDPSLRHLMVVSTAEFGHQGRSIKPPGPLRFISLCWCMASLREKGHTVN